ncbi:hypothetical protein ACI65C_011573 [Semiaphis heraclei]
MPLSSGRKHNILSLPGLADSGGIVYQLYRWRSCIPKLSHRRDATTVVVSAAAVNRGKRRPTDRRTVPAYKNHGPTLFRRQNFTSHRRTYTRSLRARTQNPHGSRRFCRRLLHRRRGTPTTSAAPRRPSR